MIQADFFFTFIIQYFFNAFDVFQSGTNLIAKRVGLVIEIDMSNLMVGNSECPGPSAIQVFQAKLILKAEPSFAAEKAVWINHITYG